LHDSNSAEQNVWAKFIRELNKPALPSGYPKFFSSADDISAVGRASEFGRSARWCSLI